MAYAQVSRNADPILADPCRVRRSAELPGQGFQLTDQHGQTVSLASLGRWCCSLS
jgi:hypothetical protein